MELQEFLHTDQLRLGKPGNGIERLLVDLTEERGLHECFQPWEAKDDPAFADHRRATRHWIATGLSRNELRLTGIPGARKMRHFRHHLLKPKRAGRWRERVEGRTNHIDEALALGRDAIDDPRHVHLYDVCSGSGILAFVIAERRRALRRGTSAECWEFAPSLARKQAVLHATIGRNDPAIHHVEFDIAQGDFSRIPASEVTTMLLGKHVCGTATDIVVQRLRALSADTVPHVSKILTCCHHQCRQLGPEYLAEEGVRTSQWTSMGHAASCVAASSSYETLLSRVTRRVMDTLRAQALRRPGAHVEEILSAEVCSRNHAICLRAA